MTESNRREGQNTGSGGPRRSPGDDRGAPTEPPAAREPHGTSGGAHSESPHDELGFDLPEPAKFSAKRAIAIGGIVAAVLVGAFVLGWLPKHRAQAALKEESQTKQSGAMRVQVTKAKVGASDRAVVLPGSVQALEETVLYPRASGYVRRWFFDIGDQVKEGALLAEIETPEIDQQLAASRAQLAQAQAGLVQAKANSDFSRQNVVRYEPLAEAGVASQQDFEKQKSQAVVDNASIEVAEARLQAQRADLQRLTELKSFSRVTAPFDGKVVARNVERGALVTAGNASPLFRLAASETVRVFLQVPQDIAPSIVVGGAAAISTREYPGRQFEGKVARAAGALDTATRTMTTEVRVPNPKGELFPGMYAEVSLKLPVPHRVLELPATALINDAKGIRVATVGPDDVLHLVPVVLERDNGATIEVASGLTGEERIVRVASVEMTEGRNVEVVQ